MKRIILHPGHFKTGTSSFQHRMAEVHDKLLDAGVLYPVGDATYPHQHGNALGAAVRLGDVSPVCDLLQLFDRSGADTLVLSGEVLSNATPSSLRDLVALLKESAPVQIVYTIRDWLSYLPSRYAQNCKRTDGWTWWHYLEATEASFARNVDVNFALNIDAFAAAGGDDLVLLYHRPGRAVADLLNAMGLKDRIGDLVLTSGGEPRLNTRSNSDLIEATRLMNALLASVRGEPPNRLFESRLRCESIAHAYQLGRLAKLLLQEQTPGAELRALIDEHRDEPACVAGKTQRLWLDELKRATARRGLAPPPQSWEPGMAALPSTFKPSRVDVENLPLPLREHLTALLLDHERAASGA